jgi:hypothetical protein
MAYNTLSKEWAVCLNPKLKYSDWLPFPPPPDDPAWQEARLRDAVVEAAIEWTIPRSHALTCAVDALRAHRAKKGGA